MTKQGNVIHTLSHYGDDAAVNLPFDLEMVEFVQSLLSEKQKVRIAMIGQTSWLEFLVIWARLKTI